MSARTTILRPSAHGDDDHDHGGCCSCSFYPPAALVVIGCLVWLWKRR